MYLSFVHVSADHFKIDVDLLTSEYLFSVPRTERKDTFEVLRACARYWHSSYTSTTSQYSSLKIELISKNM